jgi:hypothetical protein
MAKCLSGIATLELAALFAPRESKARFVLKLSRDAQSTRDRMTAFAAPPFAPGTSPFHVKGIVYRGHVEFAEKFIPGGTAAVNATFQDRALGFFFDQQFLAASWYDALPLVPLWRACAPLMKQTSVEFLRARTRHQAELDIHGVYRLLLKLASAEAVALRIPRAVGQYFDFGTTEAKVVSKGVVRIEHTGLPLLLAQWFGIVGETFLEVALEAAGARKINVRRQPPTQSGMAHGLPLANLVGEVEFG